ncbi:unnamed protein product, partial [Nesidiocoris tenuis]
MECAMRTAKLINRQALLGACDGSGRHPSLSSTIAPFFNQLERRSNSKKTGPANAALPSEYVSACVLAAKSASLPLIIHKSLAS